MAITRWRPKVIGYGGMFIYMYPKSNRAIRCVHGVGVSVFNSPNSFHSFFKVWNDKNPQLS